MCDTETIDVTFDTTLYDTMSDYDGPMLLDDKTIEGVAKYIQSRDCKRIFVMVRSEYTSSNFRLY